MPDYATLRLIWWLILGALLIGFAVMDGFDLGVGATFRFLGRTDEERRALLESIEPVWEGNQVWFILARRRGVRGLAAAVRGLVLRAVSGDVRAAGGAHPASRRLHLPQQASPIRAGATRGTGRCSSAARYRRCCSASRSAICSSDCRFISTSCNDRCSPAACFALLRPFALLAGVVSLSMLVMHGTVYAALKVGRADVDACGRARPQRGGRVSSWPSSPPESGSQDSAAITSVPSSTDSAHQIRSTSRWR